MRNKLKGAALAALTVVLATLAISASAGASGTTRLSGEVLPGLNRATDLGPVSSTQEIAVAITVDKNLNALYRAEWAMYDPGSSNYHHFIAPAEFQHRYGTPPAQLAAIRGFGTSHGLRLIESNLLGDYVELWGTAAQVESTFGVALRNFKDAQGQTFFANLQAPSVPAGLGIDAVLGLESFDRYQLDGLHGSGSARSAAGRLAGGITKSLPSTPAASGSAPAAPSAGSAQQGQCQSDPTGKVGSVCTGLLSPQALWKAYDLPAGSLRTADYGQGQTIGIIGEGQTQDVIAALREYEKTRGLPFVPVQVYHTDPGESAAENTLDDSGRIEWEMDTQSSTGMAPEVSQVRMYFGSSLDLTELTGAIGTWVNDPNGPLQVSASLGACEDTPAEDILLGAAQRADQAFLIQAAMEGRTLFASAGDTGTGCAPVGTIAVNGVTYDPYPGQEYPAIDPNTTAVGGTVLYSTTSGGRALERAWDHTGGGPSKFLPQPPYQAKAASPFLESNTCPGVYGNGSPFPGSAPFLCRADVDVSAESGDATISADHKVGDADVAGGYNPSTAPVQPNGFDMVDFCESSQVASEEPAEPDCAYDAHGAGKTETVKTDLGSESGFMTDHFSEGGTSLASPLWLGMWARVQAHHDAGNSPKHSLGLANELIYKLGGNSTTDGRDFFDVETGANPLPAAPGWDYPTGWGSPNVTSLTEDASGTPKTTAPAKDVLPETTDPAPIVAPVPHGPACRYAFYNGDPSAPDPITGNQDSQLALIEGALGLTQNRKDLRVVMTIQDLSKTVPTGANFDDYEFWWTNPSAESSKPNAVDVQVDSSGNVTYKDGTESVTSVDGENDYSFSPSSSSAATGSFASGKNGKIEVDVPLSELGSPKAGAVLVGPSAYTADGQNVVVTSNGFIVDQAGPGNSYTLGQKTCVDPQ